MRVAICGGSIAGLSVALTLSCTGHDVQVFEREPAGLYGRGGGVAILRRMVRFLEMHGHHCRPAISVPTHRRRWVDHQGKLLHDEAEILPFSSWDMIYRSLSSELPSGIVHYGRSIASFESSAGGATINFADGQSLRADLLVAADGTSSGVRRCLYPDSEPQYAGYLAWRGLVEESSFESESIAHLIENITLHRGDGELFMTFLVPSSDGSLKVGERRFNWIWYRNQAIGSQLDACLTDRMGHRHHQSVPPGLLSDESLESLNVLARSRLPASLAALVLATSKPFLHAISDLVSPHFSDGNICLVGDAACTLRPHTASGTSKAAEDAATLADALSVPSVNVPYALSVWAEARRAAAGPLVDRGKKLAASFGLGTLTP